MSDRPKGALPCPFCGGINILQEDCHLFCFSCGADGPDADSNDPDEALAQWNQRRGVRSERERIACFVETEYVRQFVKPWREDLAAAIRKG